MDIREELKRRTDEVEDILRSYLPKEEGHAKTLISAMNYSVMGGGKRIRPIMMKETYKLFGGKGRVIEPFMAAMEMIHTYSLVHDDLPAMDDDELRRGRKTTHVVYGEAMGILAGDALLTYAFEVALKAFDEEPENKGIPEALKVLAEGSGYKGMAGGQSIDMECTGRDLDEDTLLFIYDLKTCALIEASMVIGAILAGAAEDDIEKMRTAAHNIGLAFQIQDDILDIEGDEAVIGKPTMSDEKNNKNTYATLMGLETAKKDAEDLYSEAEEIITSLKGDGLFLRELINALSCRKK